jgi:hypothetical protein
MVAAAKTYKTKLERRRKSIQQGDLRNIGDRLRTTNRWPELVAASQLGKPQASWRRVLGSILLIVDAAKSYKTTKPNVRGLNEIENYASLTESGHRLYRNPTSNYRERNRMNVYSC